MSLSLECADFVKSFEGFAKKAMFDVNAFRIGHGSDTITLPDGSFRKVKEGDTTTLELARIDLARRIDKEFIPRVKKQIGDEWDSLSDKAKIALVDLAYNYGSVKKAIVAAAKTGDEKKLADTIISATYNDNKKLPEGVRNALRKRRKLEAELILGATFKTSAEKVSVSSGGGLFGLLIFAVMGYAFYYFFIQ